jgi:hypothetical protein
MLVLVALASMADSPSIDFDCDRAVVIGMPPGSCWDRFGRNVETVEGPLIAGRPTVQLLHQPEWGTGTYRDAVTLLAKEGARYRPLWTHTLIHLETGQPGAESDAATAKTYKWTWDSVAQRITVTGLSLAGDITDVEAGEVDGERRELPVEHYCYSAVALRFERCGP